VIRVLYDDMKAFLSGAESILVEASSMHILPSLLGISSAGACFVVGLCVS
jgi:hypothetical protein